jgi:predicted amidohydrolase
MTNMKLKIACVQMRSSDNIEANIESAAKYIKLAKQAGADFICTPEMTSLLDNRPAALFKKAKPEVADTALSYFSQLAKELNVCLLLGSLAILVSKNKCANRSFLISSDGTVIARYDKIHMFDVELSSHETYKESNDYQAGNRAVVAEIFNRIKVGLTICYDLRFPNLYKDLALAGASIITVPAAFTKTTGEAHWHILLRARAIETGCFIVAAAQGGKHADGRETYGHSIIIDPWGNILAEAGVDPCFILAEINLDTVRSSRGRIPNLKNIQKYSTPKRLELW